MRGCIGGFTEYEEFNKAADQKDNRELSQEETLGERPAGRGVLAGVMDKVLWGRQGGYFEHCLVVIARYSARGICI